VVSRASLVREAILKAVHYLKRSSK
jgi:hypothetical protein